MFGKKIMMGFSSFAAFSMTSASFAGCLGDALTSVESINNDPGFYIGALAGIAKADYGDALKTAVSEFPNGSSSDDGGAGFRLSAGYNFNQYFATEAGYNFFPTNKYSLSFGDFHALNLDEKTQAVDVVGKASLPVTPNVSVYGKAGAAYVMAKATGSFEESTNSLEPTYGAGVAYHLNRNVSMDASWSQIYGKDSETELNTPRTNLFGLGLNYKF